MLFRSTNVEERAVIEALDADTIYRIPLLLKEQHLDDIVVDKLRLNVPAADLSEWQAVVDAMDSPTDEITVAMVGKYVDLTEAYKSLSESLIHAGLHTHTKDRKSTRLNSSHTDISRMPSSA